MFSYSPDDILAPTPQPAITAPAIGPATPTAQVAPARDLNQEEIAQVGQLPPSLQNALAPLILAYKEHPQMLSALVREALSLPDRIARGENPTVSPELANYKAEAQKIETDKREAMKDVANLFIAPLTLGAATIETASAADPAQQTLMVARNQQQQAQNEEWRRRQQTPVVGGPAAKFAALLGGEAVFASAAITGMKDMGTNMAAFVDHVRDTGPQPTVPDVRAPSPDRGTFLA